VKKRLLVAVCCAALLWVGNVGVAMAGGIPLPDQHTAIGRAQCTNLIAQLKAEPTWSALTPSQRASVPHIRSTDCFVSRKRSTLDPVTTASAAYERDYYDDWNVYVWPINVATVHLHFGFYYDFNNAWYKWKDCHVTTFIGYGQDVTWCGFSGNYTPVNLQFGMNYDIWAYATPWWKLYGYERDNAYRDGAVYVWGCFNC